MLGVVDPRMESSATTSIKLWFLDYSQTKVCDADRNHVLRFEASHLTYMMFADSKKHAPRAPKEFGISSPRVTMVTTTCI